MSTCLSLLQTHSSEILTKSHLMLLSDMTDKKRSTSVSKIFCDEGAQKKQRDTTPHAVIVSGNLKWSIHIGHYIENNNRNTLVTNRYKNINIFRYLKLSTFLFPASRKTRRIPLFFLSFSPSPSFNASLHLLLSLPSRLLPSFTSCFAFHLHSSPPTLYPNQPSSLLIFTSPSLPAA